MPDEVYFTFGRMNPPTKGHELMIRTMINKARAVGAKPYILTTTGYGKSYNKYPLNAENKVRYLQQMFPGVPVIISNNPGAFRKNMGPARTTIVRGLAANTKNGNFSWCADEFCPIPRNTSGGASWSGTNARKAARAGHFEKFKNMLSNKLANRAREIMNKIAARRNGIRPRPGASTPVSASKRPASKRSRRTSVV